MSLLHTFTGRLGALGPGVSDADMRTYQTAEIVTQDGVIDMGHLLVPNQADRAMEPGRDVSILLMNNVNANDDKKLVLAAYDREQGRTFVDKRLTDPKSHLTKQAWLLSIISILGIPIGLALFVFPGLYLAYYLWKVWAAAAACPEEAEIQRHIEALPGKFQQAGAGG